MLLQKIFGASAAPFNSHFNLSDTTFQPANNVQSLSYLRRSDVAAAERCDAEPSQLRRRLVDETCRQKISGSAVEI